MAKQYPAIVAALEGADKELHEAVMKVYDLAFAPGELDAKTKVLIVMAIDAALGSAEGVQVLSDVARKAGATDAQVREALRLAYMTAGMGAVVAAPAAFKK